MPRSLLIDASNHIHRDWHIMKDVENTVRCFMRRMDAFHTRLKPDRFIVCFDSKINFRKSIDPNYKAGRSDKDADLIASLSACRSAAVQEGFDTIEEDGFEADDLIATFTHQDQRRRWQTIISSTDKDLRQLLVEGQVTLMTGWSKDYGGPIHFQWFTAKTLQEQFGFTPKQWLEYQILAGDSGDNVKGCPGIGEKTATTLIQKHGLDALIKNHWLIPGDALRRKFAAWVKGIDTARSLVELRKDVPLPEYWGIEATA